MENLLINLRDNLHGEDFLALPTTQARKSSHEIFILKFIKTFSMKIINSLQKVEKITGFDDFGGSEPWKTQKTFEFLAFLHF